MALPRKLKHLNLFIDGENWIGIAEQFTPATLSKKWENYRGGGMMGAAKIDMGYEDDAFDVSFILGGFEDRMIRQHSAETINGTRLRFSGSYQRDDTGDVSVVEIVCHGRYGGVEMGDQKTGDNSQTTVNMACTYYKVMVDGEAIIEVDVINMIEIINGEDRMAAHRAAIGL